MPRNRHKFVELAEKRVSRAIKDLRLIGNLANRSNYEFASEDADKIVGALEREIRALKARFTQGTDSDEVVFKL